VTSSWHKEGVGGGFCESRLGDRDFESGPGRHEHLVLWEKSMPREMTGLEDGRGGKMAKKNQVNLFPAKCSARISEGH